MRSNFRTMYCKPYIYINLNQYEPHFGAPLGGNFEFLKTLNDASTTSFRKVNSKTSSSCKTINTTYMYKTSTT